MYNVWQFIRSKKIILVALISLLSIIFIIVKINSNDSSVQDKTGPKIGLDTKPAFKSISAGSTFDEDKVNELLGYPTNATSEGNLKINEYRSSSEYRTNQLRVENNEISFIKEVVNPGDNRNVDDMINTYGTPGSVLYEKASDSYFNLYVYSEYGLAYLGHEDGTLLEVWYFKPMNIDTFITTWAPNYQKEPFREQTSH